MFILFNIFEFSSQIFFTSLEIVLMILNSKIYIFYHQKNTLGDDKLDRKPTSGINKIINRSAMLILQ